MLIALERELILRKKELGDNAVKTIYFGGGTPSILSTEEIRRLISVIQGTYKVVQKPEITLEANPDDLSKKKITDLARSPINRLSIGVQSFFDSDLRLLNRAHNSKEASNSIRLARSLFENISIDLIYGIPHADDKQWIANIEKTLAFGVPHVSAYALTVEPKTALKKFIKKGLIPEIDEEVASAQFFTLIEILEQQGFLHYEISNFGKEGYLSKNNTAYWTGKSYLGIGPSAHSFDGNTRKWNVRNNIKYINAISRNELPSESEVLTKIDRYNEYIMTSLRTMWGISLSTISANFGEDFVSYLMQQASDPIEQGFLTVTNESLVVPKAAKFLSDGIASGLFMLKLK